MFTVDELLSKKNQAAALTHFAQKKDGTGPSGQRVSDIPAIWKANQQRIEHDIRNSCYEFAVVKAFEQLSESGKQRTLCNIEVIDRFVERLLQQKLARYLCPLFLPGSHAYQEGKGATDLAMAARDFVANGCVYVCEVDIADFFDEIPHARLFSKLREAFPDPAVLALLKGSVERWVDAGGKIEQKRRGVLQGSSVSPSLSNFYLHPLDVFMEGEGWNWLRFADNIYVYCEDMETVQRIYNTIIEVLGKEFFLKQNTKKSGVYKAIDRRVLGYEFFKIGSGIDLRKHQYQPRSQHSSWHQSSVYESRHEYHIVQDGILTKKDYSILFENEDEKHHIPIEVVDHLNIYGNVTVSPDVLRLISSKNIRITYFGRYGNMQGVYTPAGHGKSAEAFLRQCELYTDQQARLDVAKRMEIAALHNIRANVRYYAKKRKQKDLSATAEEISSLISKLNEAKDVSGLMLIEAQARKHYYEAFGQHILDGQFSFSERTKRPPKDEANAMISFGNTVLYNRFLQIIFRGTLDPKIGVVHATNRRDYSLNLDFADIFKPVIVDRVVFSLVNRHEIKTSLHFERTESGGVLLNAEGKRIFLRKFDEKMHSELRLKDTEKAVTYAQLLEAEVRGFQKMLLEGEKYRPYKYY